MASDAALRDQQALLASVLDNLPLGVGVYDRDGVLARSNRRMREYPALVRLPTGAPGAPSQAPTLTS